MTESSTTRKLESLNPATGDVVGVHEVAGPAEVDGAVARAREAAGWWSALTFDERRRILGQWRGVLARRLGQLADLVHQETGKPHPDAQLEIGLAIDHLAWAAGHAEKVLGPQKVSAGLLMANQAASVEHLPLGVIGVIGPWNYPVFTPMGSIVYALAAGNTVVFKPSEYTPGVGIWLADSLAEVVPDKALLQVVVGYGETGAALCGSGVDKLAFTGSTATGRVIAQAAANNLIPATLELGGKSPNIFFADIADADDAFFDKAVEGMVLFAFNQGEVCTCPSRALIQESIYDKFMARVLQRVAAIKQGNPLDTDCMMGAQASMEQMKKIESYLAIGKEEGAELLIGGARAALEGDLANGYYIQPTMFKGHNKMRIFQEEIFGPVLAVTTFKDEAEALAIANDTPYGLGAGVWTRDGSTAYRMGRAIQAGRVWTNCYHAYPAHATFGGYKESGIGRETHKVMLDHYQQTKNLLVSYSPKALGFF